VSDKTSDKVAAFLTALHAAFPAHPARHNLTINDQGRLTLAVWKDGSWYTFHAENEDMDDIEESVAQIRAHLASDVWGEL
jgi:hypothetical protein